MSEILDPQLPKEAEAIKKTHEVLASSEEGQAILRAIYDAPSLTDEPAEKLLTGEEALKEKLFISTENLRHEKTHVIVNAEHHTSPIQIPLDLVVDAQSFFSWKGRHKGVTKTISTDEGYQTLPSIDVIKRYASMDPTKRPIIPEFDMFIQPDGKVFFANSNDGSHRLAAAIYNGEKTVPTLSLRVRHLDDKVL